MMWLVIIGGTAIVTLVFRWAVASAFGSAKVTGAPTAEAARIEQQASKEADSQREEVRNASGSDLLDLADKRLRRK